MDWVRVGERLDGWERGQVVEIVVGWGKESGLEGLERKLLGLLGRDLGSLKGTEGSESVLV